MRPSPQTGAHSPIDFRLETPARSPVFDRMDILLLGLAAVWFSAVVIAPFIESRGIYAFFSNICHQLPARSWSLAGEPLAACIRCTSIYAGFLIALALRLPPLIWFLRASVALLVLELSLAHLWVDLETARTVSGLALGLASAGFVAEGLRELASRLAGDQNLSSHTQTEDILEHV